MSKGKVHFEMHKMIGRFPIGACDWHTKNNSRGREGEEGMSDVTCARCSSHAINQHMHGRVRGVDADLCDVCYWRKRAEEAQVCVNAYAGIPDAALEAGVVGDMVHFFQDNVRGKNVRGFTDMIHDPERAGYILAKLKE